MKKIYNLLTKDELNKCSIISLRNNDILFYENDVCECISIIVKGNIVISSYSFSGNEIIYNALSDGDMFGENLLFSSKPLYRGNVISKGDSKLILIKKDILLEIFKENDEFLSEYLKIQSNFAKELNTKLKLLAFKDAKDRLYYYMYINNNEIEYKSVTELSNRLYIKRETLSRLLSKLIKNNQIIKENKTIKLIKW
ncbi:MAG: Crp/Fnr family transcriptional regulator [Gammaproteobacteria bacterium]|nr:Crp/Fnr family transcriptional regulator [Gammaproteobacteria bacterium]